ncbi:hypothetical protein Hanom_Chr06g00563781 [Helianthus anomalus]
MTRSLKVCNLCSRNLENLSLLQFSVIIVTATGCNAVVPTPELWWRRLGFRRR